jgi:hypothetical protein
MFSYAHQAIIHAKEMCIYKFWNQSICVSKTPPRSFCVKQTKRHSNIIQMSIECVITSRRRPEYSLTFIRNKILSTHKRMLPLFRHKPGPHFPPSQAIFFFLDKTRSAYISKFSVLSLSNAIFHSPSASSDTKPTI